MTADPNQSAKAALAEEKRAQAETNAQAGREAMAEYRAREGAADDNANRLKELRLARDAETAAQGAEAPKPARKRQRVKASTAPNEGLRPDHLTTENDG